MGGINIRFAKQEDIPRMLFLGKLMHEESNYAEVPFEDGMCTSFFEIILNDPSYCVFLAERKDEVIGGFIGCVSPFFFSTLRKTNDIALFVDPENRGAMAAVLLVKAYEQWAWQQDDVVQVNIGVTTGFEKAGEFYEKMGYNRVGALYRKDMEI